jgi:hypothetical protein
MQALGVSPTTADWRFATATEPVIQALARATGFTYRYDAPTAGFCDRYCRDRFELAEKLRRINGQAGP